MSALRTAGRRLPLAMILASLAGAAAGEAPSESQLVALARRYVETLFGDDRAALHELHDAKMTAAMTAPQVERLRAGLSRQLGELARIGTPWLADRVQGYARLRVPLEFAADRVDALVVIGGDRKVAGLFFLPHVAPPDESEPQAPGEQLPVKVGDGDGALPGVLLIPPGEPPFAGVVLVHGSGPNDRDGTLGPNKPLRDLAWGLAARGIASLRYDKRSLARPESLAALGEALTVEHEVIRDARAALRALAADRRIDRSRIYLVGHSLGGTVLPRIPADDLPVAGLVVLAGATLPLPEKVVEQSAYLARLQPEMSDAQHQQLAELEEKMRAVRRAIDGEAAMPADSPVATPVGYFLDLEAHPPAQIAAAAGRPILVLQGERDYQVTMRDFALWQQALADQEFACLASYPELDHLFRVGSGPSTPADYEMKRPFAPAVLADIAAWVRDGACPR